MLKQYSLVLLVSSFLTITFVKPFSTLESLQVQVQDGPVQGYPAKSYDGKPFIAFEGIPYAKPPVGNLRFHQPESPEKWAQPLHANKSYICTQFLPIAVLGDGVVGQEDCLYMNIYIPGEKPQENPVEKGLDVVVHIHGGAFMLGAPKWMAGPKFIMNENVIYVSFNYRINIFGFLSTNDNAASGNWGLKDQNFALKWIKSNVAKFGGNPDSITLTGQSAGSASVHYHVLSEKSKGLFNKAVLLSGTALNPWALTENPLAKAQKLATNLNCPLDTSAKLVSCLRDLEARKLALGLKQFVHLGNVLPVTTFGPTVEPNLEEAFITESPYQILKGGNLGSDVPMTFSFCTDEGIFPSGYFAMLGQINTIKENWFEVMRYGMDFQDTVDENDLVATLTKIKEYYYPGDDLTKDNIANLTKLWSDRFYFHPLEKAIRLHLGINKRSVYLYMFDYDSPAFNAVFPSVKGVAHSEDLALMFNLAISPLQLTEEDHQMSHLLTQILANFAKDSIPINNWHALDTKNPDGELKYYYITQGSANGMDAKMEIAPKEFWDELPINEEY